MKLKITLTKNDKIQIGLNIIAFFVLISSPGGTGSFWGFLTFLIISCIILLDIVTRDDRTAMWLWITKIIAYIGLCIKFAFHTGEPRIEYLYMIILSVVTFIISQKFIPKRLIALWGQNVAYCFGGYLYITAVRSHPENFGGFHIAFWILNAISFGLLIKEVFDEKKHKDNLIIPGFAFVVCLLYIGVILW